MLTRGDDKAAESPRPFPPKYTNIKLIRRTRMSVTWKALDEETETDVVLKEPTAEVFLTPEGLDQFRQEVRIAARLVHANIVPIRETALEEYPYYFTMPFVEGAHLDQFCKDNHLSTTRRLALFQKICEAVSYAHDQGVHHRDLKPNNILVSNGGEPQILDFGLGQFVDNRHEAGEPGPGKVTGALGYMAPEQASGLAGNNRTDVYGLGVVLFELLTGRRPIEPVKGDVEESLRRIREDRPPEPRGLVPSLSPELNDIILKAIEKDPECRYGTVSQLVADLNAVLNGRAPQGARPPWPRRLSLWTRRNRVGVAVGAVVLLGAVSFTAYTIQESIRNHERLERARSDELVAAARWGIWRDEPERAGRILWEQHLKYPSPRTRYALWELYLKYPCVLSIPCGQQLDVEYSHQGEWLLSVAQDGSLLVHDAGTGRLNQEVPLAQATARRAKFSPDGRRLYVGGSDARIGVFEFNAEAGTLAGPVQVLDDAVGRVNCLAISPDGRWLAAGTGRSERIDGRETAVDAGAWLWEIGENDRITFARKLEGQPGVVASVAFGPGNQTLATGTLMVDKDGVVRTWDVGTGQLLATSPGSEHRRALVFAPDGDSLFLEGSGLSQWSPTLGTYRALEHDSGWGVRAIDIRSRNDRWYVASASGDGRIRFFDGRTDEQMPFQGYHAGIANGFDVAFSPNGDRAASAGPDGLKIWACGSSRMLRLDPCGEDSRYVAMVSNQGAQVVVARETDTGLHDPMIWRPGHDAIQPLQLESKTSHSMAVTADGRYIVFCGESSGPVDVLNFYDCGDGKSFPVPIDPPIAGSCLAYWYGGSAKLLFLCCGDGTLRLVRMGRGFTKPKVPIEIVKQFESDCTSIAQDSAGQWLAACTEGGSGTRGTVCLWRSTGRPLAASSFDEAYELVTEQPIPIRDYLRRVALLHDPEEGLIAATVDGNFKDIALWSPTGELVGRLYGHRESIRQCHALNDHMLVTASDDGTARIWDIRKKAELSLLCEYRDQRPYISVGDGCIAIGSRDGVSIANLHDVDHLIESARAYESVQTQR